ncbi:CPBP family intramembrane metalloprotease [Bacillus cereus]|uniref:CPBP family intramembrane metalloprotease n=1 Tax=Bacillus cereus TaxID=1396 RepID=A0A2B2L3J9_BACCE|nr:CPBP family intramembrane metalloprotease [Bacillus cereus]
MQKKLGFVIMFYELKLFQGGFFVFDILKKQCRFNKMSAISLGIFMFYMILRQIIALVYFISDEQFGGISLSFDAINLLIVLIIYFYYRRSKEPFTNQNNFTMSLQKSLLLGLVLTVVCKFLPLLLANVISFQSSNQVALESQITLPILVFAFSVALVAPIGEEIVYRGVIQHGIFKNSWLGVLVSSAIFAGVHVSLLSLEAIPYLLLGISLGCTYKLTGRLYVGIIMHMINNSVAVIAVYYL